MLALLSGCAALLAPTMLAPTTPAAARSNIVMQYSGMSSTSRGIDSDRQSRSPGIANNFYDKSNRDFRQSWGGGRGGGMGRYDDYDRGYGGRGGYDDYDRGYGRMNMNGERGSGMYDGRGMYDSRGMSDRGMYGYDRGMDRYEYDRERGYGPMRDGYGPMRDGYSRGRNDYRGDYDYRGNDRRGGGYGAAHPPPFFSRSSF